MIDTDVLDALWAEIEPIVFITKGQFSRGLDDWDVEVMRDGEGKPALVALTQGTEFHLASFGAGIPITRAMMRARLDPILERHGCVTTSTPKDGMDRQHRFNRAFGFKVAGESEFFVHYRLEQTPFPS